ncbi:MAG: MobA/MobL family protein [Gammaproteobacteria bacterium]|nr:MobA/MobL family protein [Gammaproteobacteria bacterium]
MIRIEVKVASRNKGQSTVAMACYRSAAKIKDKRLGVTHNYHRRTGVDKSLILTPFGAPEIFENRDTLWNEVEKVERRKDAQLSREFLLSLPNIVAKEENYDLALDWVKKNLVSEGMIADISFHDMDTHNPHAHVMTTMRTITRDGFGKKMRSWNKKEALYEWRRTWSDAVSHAITSAKQSSPSRMVKFSKKTTKKQHMTTGINFK